MDKKTKKKLSHISTALFKRGIEKYHHTLTPDEYMNELLILSDDDEAIENLFFDLGLSVYMKYAVEIGLKQDVEAMLTDFLTATEDLTGNDEDAVKEYKSLLNRIQEFL